MSNCHRPLSMWFGENYKSEEESSEENNLDPDTMKLDRPLSLQQAQIMFNYFYNNKDLLSSKTALIRLERAVSMAHMQIRDSKTLFSSFTEIMNYIIRNIERLSRDSDLVPPLLELFQQIQYRAKQEVELRDSQMIEVQNTQTIEVRDKQIRNENPYREICDKYKLADKIKILDSMNHRVFREGISKRKTEKNRKIRQKRKEKEMREMERDEEVESMTELPCKRSNCEEIEKEMQEVCKKVKENEEFPKGWLVNVGFLDEEERKEREDVEVIYDKYGDLELLGEIKIFEDDEHHGEGSELPQNQEGFKLHEDYEEARLPQYEKEVKSASDRDKETVKSPDDEVAYKSSLDHQEESKPPEYLEESKLPQYLEESKLPVNQEESQPLIKLHRTDLSEESHSAEELSDLSHSESELPDSLPDDAELFNWYIVSNEQLSSYQGRNNDMIIPESRCLSRFPF